MRRTKFGVVLAILAIFAVAGFAVAQDEAAKVEKGKAVFEAQKCSMCHAIAGKGNSKNPLDDVGNRLSADQIKKYVTAPKEVKADSKMKAYASLPAEDLDALAAYLLTLKKQ